MKPAKNIVSSQLVSILSSTSAFRAAVSRSHLILKAFSTLCNPVSILTGLFLLLSACSISTAQLSQRIPKETRSILSLSLDFTPIKAAYSNIDNSLYVMGSETNLIQLYKGNNQVNTIGGLGFGESNFNRLTDITVSPHGRLLALDSFQKTIKKFDSDGMWLENYPLRSLNEPLLFDVSHDGMVFIYDRTSNEIVIYDEKLEYIEYRFGKFLLRDPIQLNCTFQHLSVYDKSSDKTYIFDLLGDLQETLNGFWQIDRYTNRYRLTGNMITVFTKDHWEKSKQQLRDKTDLQPDSIILLSAKPWNSFSVSRGVIKAIADRELLISEIVYERF